MNKILITMGDPAGIGPEIVVKFFDNLYKVEEKEIFIAVCGSKSVLQHYINQLNLDLEIQEIEDINDIRNMRIKNGVLPLINYELELDMLKFGEVSELAGNYTMTYLTEAVKLVRRYKFDAIVTAPLNKDSINLAGFKYSGHTSFLADTFNTKDFGMVLKGKKITVVLNTTHLSIIDAVKQVKKDSILSKIKLAYEAKRELGIKGTIAVAGLNPHNGENGLFGNEESVEISPAVEEAKRLGFDVEGPIVPDSLFVKMLQDKYGIAVVMYHDQGLIPMKMESFGCGVNITVGLPIVRTSVDHGTAFDIVGKKIADYGSLNEAVRTAYKIINNRKNA